MEVEDVVSGRGLPNLHRATHSKGCDAGIVSDDPGAAEPRCPRPRLERRCESGALKQLGIFVDAYGAEAGNAALRSVATAGVFIGGGITPKILPALTDGRFMTAFKDKGRDAWLVENVPVKIILNAGTPGCSGQRSMRRTSPADRSLRGVGSLDPTSQGRV